MPTITIRYPNGTTQTFYELVPAIDDALRAGAQALRPDGTPYNVQSFLGGFLFDGCTENRVLYGYYTPGQKEALQSAGIVCALDIPEPAPPPPPPPMPPIPPSVPATNSDDLVGPPQVQPLIAVPTGEPTSTVVATVIANVIGALGGIFGRGLPGKVAKEIFALRDTITQLGMEIVRLGQLLAKGIKAVLEALRTLHDKVLKRAVDQIEKINSRITRIIDKILGPYLDLLQRIRQLILDIYGRLFLPIIELLQMVRQMIALLRLLRVPGMKKLDEKLQRIQSKLIGVIADLLDRTNEHSGLINVLLTARMTLQKGTLLGSLMETRRRWISMWWNEQTPLPGTLTRSAVPSRPIEVYQAEVDRDLELFARTNGGPIATSIAPGLEEFRRVARLSGGV